jgi:superfamily II DNA or RNA helicase
MATFDQFINSIIADGNDGKAFEKFCKHFLETSPEYAHQFEKVWLWDDWPNKWSHDKGVDLVAKYKDRDTYCAIQAKCYAAHNTVPYNEVTNFLADSSRAEIEDRILMMSTNKLNEKTSKEVISGQEKQVTILDRDYFENKAKFDYPSHISELGKAKAKPPATPRKHQITAINDVEKGLQENDRGQLIMACGTGKTFTTLWIKERLGANAVLVLLPSLSLLSQTMREWVWGANERFEALAVCSDPTVGKSKNSDEDISTAEVGKVTWHVDEIQAFLRSPNPKVIFCTYQSSELIQLAQEDETIPQFDLVVCDEAHRCAGKANAGFATVLHEEKIRAKKRLFTTATPRYYGKSVQSAAEGRGVEIIGMDDEAKFGPVIHKLTFGQAIEMDMLTDYHVVVVGVDEPMVREWIAEGEIVSYGDENHADARTLAAKIAVLKAIKDYDLNRVISFHTNIKRAKEFASDVFDVADIIEPEQRPKGNIWSKHVDGTMSAGKRRDLINGLKELDGHDVGLLTNARCLSEGVDVPSLDGIAFIDPRGSQVDIIQAVGRAIRKSDHKTKGTIVLPVFLEAGDDPDTIIDASNFKPVWDVLKALRAHDEVLADELDQHRINIGQCIARSNNKITKVVLDLPRRLQGEFANSLTTFIVEATTETWAELIGQLKRYKEIYGDLNVPQSFKFDTGRLGGWVSDIRQRQTVLSEQRIQQLDELDFIWDAIDFKWKKAISSLQKFINQTGHTDVPTNYILDGFPLGQWVNARRNNLKESTTPARLNELNQLGFIWDAVEYRWDENLKKYSQLIDGDRRYHIRVSEVNKIDKNLAGWIRKQRKNYEDGTISTDRIMKLNQIEFIWSEVEYQFLTDIEGFKKFYNQFGHWNIHEDITTKYGVKLKGRRNTYIKMYLARSLKDTWRNQLEEACPNFFDPPEDWDSIFLEIKREIQISSSLEHLRSSNDEVYKKLKRWISRQKTAKNKEKLSPEREQKLKDIGLLDNDEAKAKRALIMLSKQNQLFKALKSNTYIDGVNVTQWVRTQRKKYRQHKLPEDTIKLFDELQISLDPLEDRWNENVLLLKKFIEFNGHALVPHSHIEDGAPLGTWVAARRKWKGKMSQDQISELDDLGFVWKPLEQEWDENFNELVSYYETNRTFKVPGNYKTRSGKKLSIWISKQRSNYRENKLSPARLRRLKKIKFPFEFKR